MNIKKIILLLAFCFSINLSFCERDYLNLLTKVSYKGLGLAGAIGAFYFGIESYDSFFEAYNYRSQKKDRNAWFASGCITVALASLSLGGSIYFFRKK
jgi:hypothetical protein